MTCAWAVFSELSNIIEEEDKEGEEDDDEGEERSGERNR